jgi:hypothetical protein
VKGVKEEKKRKLMKNLITLMFAAGLAACSSESAEPKELSSQQKWELVKMTGSMINSVTTGQDMDWQEYYIFNADSTFIKSRQRDGKVQEATGTYSYSNKPNEQSIIITYRSGLNLRASCQSDPSEERLIIISPRKLIGTWNPCDGPGLEYQLVENAAID